MDEPFGRQPQPVKVRLEGEPPDVAYWSGILASRAEFKGDAVVRYVVSEHGVREFKIFPRAVND